MKEQHETCLNNIELPSAFKTYFKHTLNTQTGNSGKKDEEGKVDLHMT